MLVRFHTSLGSNCYGDGADTANYLNTVDGLTLNLLLGTAIQGGDSDTLVGIENVVGSRVDDVIIGNDGANWITGFLGDDTMTGGAGADVFDIDLRDRVFLGDDVITDFEIGVDHVSVAGSLLHDLADLNPQQVGADTVLDLGPGTRLTLLNTNASLLSNSDFFSSDIGLAAGSNRRARINSPQARKARR
jgi:Ca2+-binding RTX toxin-like protein